MPSGENASGDASPGMRVDSASSAGNGVVFTGAASKAETAQNKCAISKTRVALTVLNSDTPHSVNAVCLVHSRCGDDWDAIFGSWAVIKLT